MKINLRIKKLNNNMNTVVSDTVIENWSAPSDQSESKFNSAVVQNVVIICWCKYW